MSNGVKIITNSEKETFNFAKKFAKKLKGGEIIGLIGDLGAGKTAFAKGIAAGLEIKKNITSPTFVLMKVYRVASGEWRVANFVHIDAYRMKSAKDLIAIGAEEYFNRLNAVTVIEWADRIKKILPKRAKFVNIKNIGEDKRLIKF